MEFGTNLSLQISKICFEGMGRKFFSQGQMVSQSFFTVLSCSIGFLPSQLRWSLAARKLFENAVLLISKPLVFYHRTSRGFYGPPSPQSVYFNTMGNHFTLISQVS